MNGIEKCRCRVNQNSKWTKKRKWTFEIRRVINHRSLEIRRRKSLVMLEAESNEASWLQTEKSVWSLVESVRVVSRAYERQRQQVLMWRTLRLTIRDGGDLWAPARWRRCRRRRRGARATGAVWRARRSTCRCRPRRSSRPPPSRGTRTWGARQSAGRGPTRRQPARRRTAAVSLCP